MDLTPDGERTRKQLLRIAALLLALASLAERACRAPLPVRFLVIVLLRPAEALAREWISGDCEQPTLADDGFDAVAALCLAERFVVLAIVLAGFPDWLGACRRAYIGISRRRPVVMTNLAGRRAEPLDTS